LVLEASAVDISMLKMATGTFELDAPADASAKIVLKPDDVQTAFNADYVKQKMRGQKIDLGSGDRVTTDASNITFTIPEAGRIAVSADVMLIEKVETHHVAFSAKPVLVEQGQGVALTDVQYDQADNDMPALTRSLIASTQDLLDFRTFDIGDITLQVTQLDVQPDRLVFAANARITSFG